MFLKLIYSITLLTVLSQAAIAGDAAIYVGGGGGAGIYQQDEADLKDDARANGVTATAKDLQAAGVGGKLFVGYQLTRNVGFELGYQYLGKLTATLDASAPSVRSAEIELDASVFSASIVGTIPVTDSIAVIARIGGTFWRSTETTLRNLSGQARRVEDEDANFDAVLGVGAEYDLGDRTAMRIEWERFMDVRDVDVDLISASVLYRF